MATHAIVPSCSVKVMSGAGLMNSGETTYSASPPSSSGEQTVTETMVAADSPSQKQENRKSAQVGCRSGPRRPGGVLR